MIHAKKNDEQTRHFILSECPNLLTLAQKLDTLAGHSAFINGEPVDGFDGVTFEEEMNIHFKSTSFRGDTWNGDAILDDPVEILPPRNS